MDKIDQMMEDVTARVEADRVDEHRMRLAELVFNSDGVVVLTHDYIGAEGSFFDQVAMVVRALSDDYFRKLLGVAVHTHHVMSNSKTDED
jgi:hypothetical protein